jgi:hypothetical protein
MESIKETKNIPGERWQEFCESFTSGNRGRIVSITVDNGDIGEALVEETIFSAIDYDPIGKGDDLVIAYGGLSPVAFHVVSLPYEIWEAQDENGKVLALEIIDTEDRKIILKFE